MNPAISHVLKFFTFEHLPSRLQEASKPFCDLAHNLAKAAPDSPETTVALRKLLEAKDAAVRAILVLVLLLLPTLALAQTPPAAPQAQPQPPQVLPFVGPNEVRYVYALSGQTMTFGSQTGYAVLMYGKAKGTIEAKAVGGKVHYFVVTPEGRRIVYAPSQGERLLWSAEPLILNICAEGTMKGWTYVIPPFKGVVIEPPQAAPQAAPAQPPQVMPTKTLYR